MKVGWFKNIFLFVSLILLQVWVFNRVHLFGLFTPLPYVYYLLKLSNKINRNVLLLSVFGMGVCIDIFFNTHGLNALSMTIAGFLRYYLLQLMVSREEDAIIPSTRTMGIWGFMRYALIIVLLHHSILFVTEAFSVFSPLILLLKIAGSAFLTLSLIFILEIFNFDPLET